MERVFKSNSKSKLDNIRREVVLNTVVNVTVSADKTHYETLGKL